MARTGDPVQAPTAAPSLATRSCAPRVMGRRGLEYSSIVSFGVNCAAVGVSYLAQVVIAREVGATSYSRTTNARTRSPSP